MLLARDLTAGVARRTLDDGTGKLCICLSRIDAHVIQREAEKS